MITASVLAAQGELSIWLLVPAVAIATSFACAAAVGLAFEGWRRLQSRRGKDILGDELPEELTAT